jgi:hypothetical protein
MRIFATSRLSMTSVCDLDTNVASLHHVLFSCTVSPARCLITLEFPAQLREKCLKAIAAQSDFEQTLPRKR